MKITRPHGHYCPYCDRVVPCANVVSGSFCIFQPTSDMTCRECEARRYPLPSEQPDNPTMTEERLSQGVLELGV